MNSIKYFIKEETRTGVIFTLPPHRSPYFWLSTAPWYKLLSLPSLPLPLKSKMAAIIFVKKILSTRSPKLRLVCILMMSPLLKDQTVSYWSFAIIIFDKFYSVERSLTQKKRRGNELFVHIEYGCTCWLWTIVESKLYLNDKFIRLDCGVVK